MYLQKRPLSPEERAMPLSKYYDIPMDMPDPLTMQIVNAGPMDPKDVPAPEQFTELMLPPRTVWKDRDRLLRAARRHRLSGGVQAL